MSKVPDTGDQLPPFDLDTNGGGRISSAALAGSKAVIFFYPKDDTPGCTTQSCGFRDSYPSFQEYNAVILGISPDSVSSHQQFKSKYSLPFTLVVDEEHSIAEQYGVWGEKASDGKSRMGIIRSHFVIDEQGKISDIQVGVAPEDSASVALKILRMQ